ncbi:hypothetical protein [Psychroserpens sp. SPM9]|uniref:hypothetical protein n=1 Tax=Psychroserpens sp. SPM9 TaxID=2975598 RepID=UPI0021A95182|nr:hypothetical protein [Psychroserpens sp. SPM9]MDG5491485.1 hypothetical protein [Psychroserpens sp. SPM9]
MTLKHKLLITLTILSVFACKKIDPNHQIDEGKIESNTYTSHEIGWEMEIPKGWDIVTMEETDAFQKKGEAILEPMLEDSIDASQIRNLLSFKKNLFNMFQSTSEPFEIQYEGEWEENNIALKELLEDAFYQQGIAVTSSDITTETIDGLDFKVYTFTVYDTKGNIILNQMMYSRWINGFDFGVNINYNNEAFKTEMLSAFKNSKFKRPKQKK